MRMWKMIFAMVCLVGLTQLVWSQNEKGIFSGSRSEGIPELLDPLTAGVEGGMDNPLSGTGSYYYGTIKITVTVYVASAFPSGTVYACEAHLNVGGDANGDSYLDKDLVIAPTPSKGVTTCTIIFNYDWQLTTPTKDNIQIQFNATANYPSPVAGGNHRTQLRKGERQNEEIKGVPTTQGQITTLTYSTRL